MLREGRGGCISAEWRPRYMCLILFLEFLLFSIGSATPSSKEYGNLIVPDVDDSSNPIAAAQLHSTSNDSPALQEVYFLPKDRLFPDVVVNSPSCYSIPGLQNLVRRVIVAVVTTVHQFQFEIEASTIFLPVEALHNDLQQQLVGFRGEDHDGTSSSSSSRRLLLRGLDRHNRRSSSPKYHFWALDLQQQLQQRKGRRMMEEASRSPVDQQMQQDLLGPPAPPGLVHNEKQDWNQDYAEPDVHPPSSN